MAVFGLRKVDEVCCPHVSSIFTSAWRWRVEQPGRVYNNPEFENDRSEQVFVTLRALTGPTALSDDVR